MLVCSTQVISHLDSSRIFLATILVDHKGNPTWPFHTLGCVHLYECLKFRKTQRPTVTLVKITNHLLYLYLDFIHCMVFYLLFLLCDTEKGLLYFSHDRYMYTLYEVDSFPNHGCERDYGAYKTILKT